MAGRACGARRRGELAAVVEVELPPSSYQPCPVKVAPIESWRDFLDGERAKMRNWPITPECALDEDGQGDLIRTSPARLKNICKRIQPMVPGSIYGRRI